VHGEVYGSLEYRQ
jgi:hypothetical protein